jgi:cytochrome c oxidase assembly protein subunit 15
VHRSALPTPASAPVASREVRLLTRLLVGLGAAVLVLGTVVTGTGPHSGDKRSARFGFDLRTVAQAHADAVMVVIGVTVALGFLLAATRAPAGVRRRYLLLVGLVMAQAALGFTQYALHLPAGLVELHILGATLFWLAAVNLALATSGPVVDLLEPLAQRNAETATAAKSTVR